MLLPKGQKLEVTFVKDIITRFIDQNGGIIPTYVIVSDIEWFDLKHEQLLLDGNSFTGMPFQENLVIEGVQVISSKEIKCGEFQIVKAKEIILTNQKAEKVSLIESQ